MDQLASTTALWWAVAVSGLYHGANPGMGWPLAVSAALMDQHRGSLWRALAALAGGHLVAMLAILLPFSVLFALVAWQREIQIGAALIVTALGVYLLINRRHPRFLARVPPTRLALWSFLAAMAHGAGLMLVPIYLGIRRGAETGGGQTAVETLMGGNIGAAFAVALAHTLSMTLAGGAIALGVYHWVGLKFLRQGWFNLDVVWALSLVAVGAISMASVL